MFVLTLVHGTWGRGFLCPSGDAPWTSDTSALCGALRDGIAPDLAFRRFRWSGRNSHTARFKAARELCDYLQDGLDRWPKAAHFVIAHSHGGNVALSALATSNLRGKVAGVVCLATPFLAAQERDIGQDPWRTLAGALLVLVLALLWLMNVLLPTSWPTPARLAVMVLVGSFLMSLILLLIKNAREHARRLRREITSSPTKRDKLLIIRSPADEASGAIAIFQFISQITVRLFLLTQSWYARFEALVNRWAKRKRKVLMVAAAAWGSFFAFLVLYAELSSVVSPKSHSLC